jgi:hypothetical protein
MKQIYRRKKSFFMALLCLLLFPGYTLFISCASSPPPPVPRAAYSEKSPDPVWLEPEDVEIRTEEVIFHDDFTMTNEEWKTDYDEFLSLNREDGYFVLEHTHAYNAAITGISTDITDRDFFIIEASMEKMTGKGESSYGIAWGIDRETISSYYLLIFENYILYGKHEKGKWSYIINWQQYPFIHKEAAANKIAFKKRDNTLEVFVNEKKVYTKKAYPLFGDTMGIILFGNLTVKADFYTITRFTEKTIPFDEGVTEGDFFFLPEHEYLFKDPKE